MSQYSCSQRLSKHSDQSAMPLVVRSPLRCYNTAHQHCHEITPHLRPNCADLTIKVNTLTLKHCSYMNCYRASLLTTLLSTACISRAIISTNGAEVNRSKYR